VKKYNIILLFLGLLWNAENVHPGLDGYNLFEYQLGNVPDILPKGMTTGYEQLNLKYNHNTFGAAVRLEQFLHGYPEKDYQTISQYNVQYKDKNLEIKAGHFYEIIGRGLLLRSYEIPGTVYEDQAYRVRHGFYRDIRGVLLKYHKNGFEIKALRGRPLINQLPPVLEDEDRRVDLVEAVEGGIQLGNHSIGGAYLRNNHQDKISEYVSVLYNGTLPLDLSCYLELAQRADGPDPLFKLKTDSEYGFYSSLNYIRANLGISFEYKDYNNFFLGSGFNDPPLLVKEHSYKTLNRSTHILNLNNEQGYQVEVYYRLFRKYLLTINMTRAVNRFGREYVYQEVFTELNTAIGRHNLLKIFYDYAQDPIKLEHNRYSAGFYLEHRFTNRWAAALNCEYQYIERKLEPEQNMENIVVHVSITKSPKLSAGLIWEISTDPFVTDNVQTFEIETDTRHWLGMDIGYRPDRNHTIHLFAGKRRGGPVCASGICYEVLDFEGFEFRLTSKF
jgi:hypothetical protein